MVEVNLPLCSGFPAERLPNLLPMEMEDPVMSKKTNLTGSLFADAAAEGNLSPDSAGLLSPLGDQIEKALSVIPVKNVDHLTLVSLLIDNTPSMEYVNPDGAKNPKGISNAEAVVEGHDLVWSALKDAKGAGAIQAHTQFINPFGGNKGVFFEFRPLAGADSLQGGKYQIMDSTPLYDASLRLLGAVSAEAQRYLQKNIEVSTVTLILSDGEDNASRHEASDVAAVVTDMLQQRRHRIYFGGLKLENIDFKRIGKEMGIPREFVKEIPSDPKAIRAFLQLFSQSAAAVSQHGADADLSGVGLGI